MDLIIDKTLPYGGYRRVRRDGDPMGYCGCVHCGGMGREARNVMVGWSTFQRLDLPCCVCDGRGFFEVAETPPQPCGVQP